MTWTFSDALTLDRDKVRWLVGDIDTADQLVTDEAIAFALTEDANIYRAAARVCRSIALKVGQRLTVNASGTKLDAAEQFEHWMEMAKDLEVRATTSGVAAFAGGLSKSGKDSVNADTDRVAPTFTRSLFSRGDATEADLTSLER